MSRVAAGASGAQALPLISELYYDAPGSDDGQLFVELVEIKACEPVCRAVEETAVLGGQ